MTSNPPAPEPGLPDSGASPPRRKGRSPKASTPPSLTADELRAVLQEQMGLVAAHVDAQIGGLEARLASLEQRPPDLQPVVDKVASVLGPELSRQITEKLQGLAASSAQASANGHRVESDAAGQNPTLAARADDLLTVVGSVADVLLLKFYPLYLDHRKEARLDRQEARADKMMDTNPFMVADTMRASNNPLLPMWAAAFAPLPQAVSDARVREATDAVLIGMRARAEATRILREERTRQNETPSQGSPSSSGSPTGSSSPLPTSPSAGVNMNSKPRLSLRAIMG